jgi:hypothetical protein
MRDGTYQKTAAGLERVEATAGYWVALHETTLEALELGDYLGVWNDQTGKVWLDKSALVIDRVEALTLAQRTDQIAIWDNLKQAEIYLKRGNR